MIQGKTWGAGDWKIIQTRQDCCNSPIHEMTLDRGSIYVRCKSCGSEGSHEYTDYRAVETFNEYVGETMRRRDSERDARNDQRVDSKRARGKARNY